MLSFIAAFAAMEFNAWFVHKYLMHGPLWFLHADHHQLKKGVQKNDLFALVFAVPSCLLIVFGSLAGYDFRFFAGLGIAAYGFTYFLVHELVIHGRFGLAVLWEIPLIKALKNAHAYHHQLDTRKKGACFGLLVVPRRFYIEAYNAANSPQ